jgi:hypothetical protein
MRSSDTKRISELDPWLFKPEAIDPETAKFNTELADLLVHVPPVWSQPAAVTRKRRETGGGPFGPLMISDMAVDRTIPGAGGPTHPTDVCARHRHRCMSAFPRWRLRTWPTPVGHAPPRSLQKVRASQS